MTKQPRKPRLRRASHNAPALGASRTGTRVPKAEAARGGEGAAEIVARTAIEAHAKAVALQRVLRGRAASLGERRGQEEVQRRLSSGPEHLLRLRALADKHTLAQWAARYLAEEVYGVQSPNTLDAKGRDLAGFLGWFLEMNSTGEISHWMPRDTQMYLNHLDGQGRAAHDR
jgi:hypothetical protein